MKVLVTGSQGFIGSYFCNELLQKGYNVIGIDNFSKYGFVNRPHDSHSNFVLIKDDVKNIFNLSIPDDIDYMVCFAAMIGGISYFHKYAYDLLAENERITASTFDFAISRFKKGSLKRIVNISSSMVFESSNIFPTPEIDVQRCSPPQSTYGFQKLSSEYFCKGAYEQYGLPYTIIRPFNCVGIGEGEAIGEDKVSVGNIDMMMSHVLPDIINRALQIKPGQSFPILGDGKQIRHYTNGKDIAMGIRIAMEHPKAENEDFNISSPVSTTVIELANIVYNYIYGTDIKHFVHEKSFKYDVQMRIPDVSKAKDKLGIVCNTPLETSIKEVADWIRSNNV